MPAAISALDRAGLGAFLDNHHPAGLLHRRADRLQVQRRKASHVDHLGADAFVGQLPGGLERIVQHQQPAEDGHVGAFAADGRLVQAARCSRSSGMSLVASTAPLSARAPFEPYSSLCSKIITGLSSRTADLSMPLAS